MPADTVIQLRQGTAAAWTTANPVLAVGEPGFETDTGRVKVGNGSSAWNVLEYLPTTFDTTAPSTISVVSAAAGSAATAARRDHIHGVSTAAPATSLTATTTNTIGTAASLARSDHVHAITTDTAIGLSNTSTSTAGTGTAMARADHTHAISGFLPLAGGTLTGALTLSGAPSLDLHAATKAYVDSASTISYGTPVALNPDVANTAGTATTVARSDHIHNVSAAPAVGLSFTTTNSEGTATNFARSDHTHAITAFDATAPAALTPDIAAAVGAATVAARRDHVHNVPAGVAVGLSATTANAEGTAADFARSDHTHAIGTAAPAAALTSASTNAVGTAVTLARSDHSHAVTFFDATVPAALTPDIAAAVGAATTAARRDHVHNVPAGTAVALTNASVSAEGSAADFARSDHTHAISGFLVQNDLDQRKLKEPVRAATTANIVLSGTQTIDGVSIIAGERVLVKNQTTGGENGIYVAAAGAWARGSGTNTAAEVTRAVTEVMEGTTNAGGVFYQAATIATLGTTVQTWNRINPAGGSVTFAVPVTLNPDVANTEGVAATAARSDHVHNVPAGPAVGISFATANAEGTAADFARSDHTHAVTAFDATVPPVLTPDIAGATGAANVAARRDHVHNVPAAAPTTALSSTTTNAEGTGTSFARNDHTHAVTLFDTTGPEAVGPGLLAQVGTAPVAARRDHVHGIAAGTPVTINITEPVLNPGVANSVARSDHVHTATGFVGLSQFNDWATYTPILRNGSTNVAKTVVSARYMWVGKLVIVTMRCNVTGAGVAGDVLLGLPVLPQAADLAIGMASHYDASANTAYNGIAYAHTAVGGNGAIYFVRDGTVSNVAHGTALANGDVVWLNCQYEAA